MRRILTIDGGGVKGAFPASFLAAIEAEIGQPFAEYFDLIVGTSTGGIIALGLGLGLPAAKIEEFYRKYGPQIFRPRRLSWLQRFLKTKYQQEDLRAALEDVFGQAVLGTSRSRLVIPSFNIETGRVHIYKTRHHARFEKDHKVKVVDVALATSAAPTFFTPHVIHGVPLVDGGMWANNPIDSAVIEAISVLRWPQSAIKVLSLGCTHSALNIKPRSENGNGELFWAKKAADVFLQGQSAGAMAKAELLIGEENITRINAFVPGDKFELDGADQIEALVGMGESFAREWLPKVRSKFIAPGAAEKFIPIPEIRATVSPSIPEAAI